MAVRPEYPRPDFARAEWMSLNGEWDFCFPNEECRKIQVPFVFQCEKSGIGDNRMCDRVTYTRIFSVPKNWKEKRIILHFGAVDYKADVFVNGKRAGVHEGGSASFAFDITELLCGGEEALTVSVWDPCADEEIPRGKQYWKAQPESIWYTRSSGIWQSVWLEPVSAVRIEWIHFTPNLKEGSVHVDYAIEGDVENVTLQCEMRFQEEVVFSACFQAEAASGSFSANLFGKHIFRTAVHDGGWTWSPEHPNLFDVKLTMKDVHGVLDEVSTYFGMRKIEAKNGVVYLNDRPYYQKLVLDQGYWPGSLLTAPDDNAFRQDIELAKKMGFNGCRKHQKAEDPRFLYWADKLGFLVWGEIPSCPSFSERAAQRVVREWAEVIARDYNHPSIVAWVILNESWGVPDIRHNTKQQAHSMALYYNVKSMDETRLIVNNDGWEMTKTDICAIHNYAHGGRDEIAKQKEYSTSLRTLENMLAAMPAGRQIYADGYTHCGEPVLLTEFGGISFESNNAQDWGYTAIANDSEFLSEYDRLIKAINASECLFGYCYTQLTDVEQEVNGLLTYDRRFKVEPEKIAEINKQAQKTHLTQN